MVYMDHISLTLVVEPAGVKASLMNSNVDECLSSMIFTSGELGIQGV
jgi:hypothetical protein